MSLFGQTSSGGSLFGSTQNTPQKPLFGGFGASQTPAQAQPSSFGSTPAATSQPAGSGFFGTVLNNSATQQSASPFGTAATATMGNQQSQSASPFGSAATSTQPQASSLFSRVTPAQPTTQSGLFGTTPSTTSQAPQATGSSSLFGGLGNNNNNNNQNQGQQQPTTSSLFGGLGGFQNQNQNQTQNQQQPASNLFGGLGNSNQNQQQSTSSLFGGLGNNSQNQQQPTSSLFGGLGNNNQSQNQQGSSSLFGSSLRPGGLTMGQSTSQPQQTVPGVKIDVSNIRGTTRFNDLHEELQKSVEQIDNFIQQQIAFKEQCEALMPSHARNLSTIPSDVEYVTNQLETAELAIEGDISIVTDVKDVVRRDADNARLGFQAAENLKLPQQFHYSGMWQRGSPPRAGVSDDSSSDNKSADLLSFFNATASSLSSTLEFYEKSLTEIEEYLGNVEQQTLAQDRQMAFRRGRDGAGRGRDDQIRELQMVLNSFQGGVLRTAERVGTVREEVSDLIEGNTNVGNGRR